jgi:hypothetical protein
VRAFEVWGVGINDSRRGWKGFWRARRDWEFADFRGDRSRRKRRCSCPAPKRVRSGRGDSSCLSAPPPVKAGGCHGIAGTLAFEFPLGIGGDLDFDIPLWCVRNC